MKLFICEDCIEDRKILQKFIQEYGIEQHLEWDVLEYASAEDLCNAWESITEEPDIIFFDIFMNGMTGMEAAWKLLDKDFHGAFIFTTTSLEHMQEGFRIHAADYLLKPYSYKDLHLALDWCKDYLRKAKKTISFTSDRLEIILYLSDITYIEAYLKTSIVHARNRKLSTYRNFTQFENSLQNESAFLKIGRGILVNFGNIKTWDEGKLYFKNGEQLALPVRNRKKVLQQLEDCYWLQIADKDVGKD